jgi:Ser/Thr protein kinase RdoA (MazF antagonist)
VHKSSTLGELAVEGTEQALSVAEFSSLTRRGQLARLRRVGRAALARYGIDGAALTTLGYAENATFRVDTGGARYLLRMNRPRVHTAGTIESEMAWLRALRLDTRLGVPEPVPATDGSLVVSLQDPAVPDPQLCALLRWLDGRLVDKRLAPSQLALVGTLTARLHTHSSSWTPPARFARPRVDVLTDAAKAEALPSAAAALPGEHPSQDDGGRALEIVESLVSAADAALVGRALELVRATSKELDDSDSFGLIHGDLHYENVLFLGSEARAIDFDDCGWGHHLYDLAVTLSKLRSRPRYDELQDAFLAAYAAERPLPEGFAIQLQNLFVLRELQILSWILESRERAAFREHWRRWAREVLDWLATSLDALEG